MKPINKKIGDYEIVNYHQHDYSTNRYIILENGFDCCGQHFSLREVISVFQSFFAQNN